LAHACKAGWLIALIISDVLGDALDAVASGPTVFSSTSTQQAIDVLCKFDLEKQREVAPVFDYLRRKAHVPQSPEPNATTRVTNLLIANNSKAVDAAGREAQRLGYSATMTSATQPEGPAEEVGRRLAELALSMCQTGSPDCLISGGEPVVRLAELSVRGKGGRNQQLALAALSALGHSRHLALVAGGTDGEDGPTDAAGAIVDEHVANRASELNLDQDDHLRRNDAYHFFKKTNGLLITGPTHTNVCDLRVITVAKR
jgi:hydroxypyruvate reductase